MERLAYFVDQAARGKAQEAAQRFLAEVEDETAVIRVMEAATWKDDQVRDFAKKNRALYIVGVFGGYWLAPQDFYFPKGKYDPPGPRISPEGLVALARALVTRLSN